MSQLKKLLVTVILPFIMLFTLIGSLFAEEEKQPVRVTLLSEKQSIVSDDTFSLLLHFSIAKNFHLYWLNPGDVGAPPEIRWTMPAGFSVQEVVWPAPSRFESQGNTSYGYSKNLLLEVKIKAPEKLESGSKVAIQADVSWVACGQSTCIPGRAHVGATIDVGSSSTSSDKEIIDLFAEARRGAVHTNIPCYIHSDEALAEVVITSKEIPFQDLQSIQFFPLSNNTVDTNRTPLWQARENNTLYISLPLVETNKVKNDLKGVLVLSFTADSLQNDIALMVDETVGGLGKFGEVGKGTLPYLQKEGSKWVSEVSYWFEEKINHFRSFFSSDFSYILLFSFLGGILLNLMPCVLPVISLKVLHFVQLQGQGRSTTFKHGLAFSFGVILSFWVLALAIYTLQAFGKTVGWGFQLQEPLFVAVLLIVLFILSLSLFGVFEFGTKVASLAGSLDIAAKTALPEQHILSQTLPSTFTSFCSGVLATFVATPCTGPFLGSALGFTATLDPLYSFTVFTCIGFGVAFPYLVLSLLPELIHLLPRPGRWMNSFKQLMGFFLLATVLWLIWVLDAETANLSLIILFASFFIISFGTWVFGTWGGYERGSFVRALAKIAALFCILFGSYILLKEVYTAREMKTVSLSSQENGEPGESWEPFSESRLEELRLQGSPVFINFTAKWCLTCQANKIVLESKAVKDAFVEYGVVKMIADWTQNDETITLFLRKLGRNGVPVYALYGKNKEDAPTILPEVITPEIVIEALKNAQK